MKKPNEAFFRQVEEASPLQDPGLCGGHYPARHCPEGQHSRVKDTQEVSGGHHFCGYDLL